MEKRAKNDRISGVPSAYLYEQPLTASDIMQYIPDKLKQKLSEKEKSAVETAFCLTVIEYRKKYDEKYLDRLLT